MNHMNPSRGSSVLIAGVLVVIAIFAALVFVWQALASMPAMALVVGWGVAAMLPFAMREVSLRR